MTFNLSARSVGMAAFAALIALPAAANAQAKAKAVPASKSASANKAAEGLRSELLRDIDDVEKKFSSLAGAMTGKYTWRPAEKIRTAGEVFMHISGENYALPVVLGQKAPSDFAAATLQEAFGSAAAMERVTDETEVKAAITKSFAHMKQALAAVPASDFDTEITVFGQKMTKRAFMVLIVNHMHEHLGQAIAYARVNGVTPPWSASGG